jgi:VWFA-related protein
MKLNKMTFIAILAVASSLLSACQPTPRVESQGDYVLQITQIDTTNFPVVDVYISARNQQGESEVINVNKLQLLENGQPVKDQNIQDTGDVGPLTTVLLIDTSGSMNFANKLEIAKEAARQYLAQMRAGDQVGIITFNTQVKIEQEITANREELEAAIDRIQAQSDTAIYDGMAVAIETLNPLPGRKAIILLTDGMDNQSTTTPEEALGSIGFGGLSISTIGLGEVPEGEEESDEYKGIDEATLKMIASSAGGQYAYAEEGSQLAAIYNKIRQALQSEVVITYETPLDLRDGVNRALTVSLVDAYQGVGGESKTSFNPGGLVPEVAQPASWMVFGIILGVLVVLLFIPVIINAFGGDSTNRKTGKKKKSKIKITLKD